MDINLVLKEFDALFRQASPDEIHTFLTEHIRIAELEGDQGSLLTLLNEQIGFARETNREDIVLESGKRLLDLLSEMEIEGTVPYGSSLLNIANAYRAYGHYDESEALFQRAEQAYQVALDEGAYEFAGLYNNWSLLYMNLGQKEKAVCLMRRALKITDQFEKAVIRQATSRGNLAVVLLDLAKECDPELSEQRKREARKLLQEAVERHEAKGGQDYHFSAILSTIADMELEEGDYTKAADYYRRAMNIIRMYMGENQHYNKLEKKLQFALSCKKGDE